MGEAQATPIRRGSRLRERRIVYCLIPADLAGKLHDELREHFLDNSEVEVVVERRKADRRSKVERRIAKAEPPHGRERRTVTNPSGRRIEDRRVPQAAIEPLPLPRRARRYADRMIFIESHEPASEAARDADGTRLALQAQAGDPDAFSELYRRYFDSVYTYLRAALKEHHEAEDRTQQVFTKVLEALRKYTVEEGIPFRAWLFRIARNEAISHLRKLGHVDVEAPETIERRREAAAPPDEPQLGLELDWLSNEDLIFLVERLPPLQRQVLTLRYRLGLSNKEIATIIGRSQAAVGQLHYRATQFLAERLEAVGRRRGSDSTRRTPMLIRLRRMPVLGARRQSLGGPPARGR